MNGAACDECIDTCTRTLRTWDARRWHVLLKPCLERIQGEVCRVFDLSCSTAGDCIFGWNL